MLPSAATARPARYIVAWRRITATPVPAPISPPFLCFPACTACVRMVRRLDKRLSDGGIHGLARIICREREASLLQSVWPPARAGIVPGVAVDDVPGEDVQHRRLVQYHVKISPGQICDASIAF